MERSHRTDDEEFYLPCLGKVRDTEGFLRLAQRWQWYYNVERPHFGVGMEGKPPMQKLRELGLDLPDEFAAFPVVLLDEMAVTWAAEGGHDVLVYYKSRGFCQARGDPMNRTSVLWLEDSPKRSILLPLVSILPEKECVPPENR